MSYFEDLVIIGTQLGRIDIYDYFSPVLKDYQIVHSSEVLAIDLVNEFKEDRLSSVGIYLI